MRGNNNRDMETTETFQKMREALFEATRPNHDVYSEEMQENPSPTTINGMDDSDRLPLTDAVIMHAGMAVSRVGVNLGFEAPRSLQDVYRRGEMFVFTTLGAVALYEASQTIGDLL